MSTVSDPYKLTMLLFVRVVIFDVPFDTTVAISPDATFAFVSVVIVSCEPLSVKLPLFVKLVIVFVSLVSIVPVLVTVPNVFVFCVLIVPEFVIVVIFVVLFVFTVPEFVNVFMVVSSEVFKLPVFVNEFVIVSFPFNSNFPAFSTTAIEFVAVVFISPVSDEIIDEYILELLITILSSLIILLIASPLLAFISTSLSVTRPLVFDIAVILLDKITLFNVAVALLFDICRTVEPPWIVTSLTINSVTLSRINPE